MEEIKEEQVQRCKRSQNAASHYKQEDVELLLTLLDFPGNTCSSECDDRAHQDQSNIYSVNTKVVADTQSAHPRTSVVELIAGEGCLKLQKHFDCQHCG